MSIKSNTQRKDQMAQELLNQKPKAKAKVVVKPKTMPKPVAKKSAFSKDGPKYNETDYVPAHIRARRISNARD